MVSGSAKTKILLALLECSSGVSVFSPELTSERASAHRDVLPAADRAARQSRAACVEKQ